MMPQNTIKLALVDDHRLFRKGLLSLIESINGPYSILFEADNGLQMKEKLNEEELPDIILMDINMPEMDGYASVEWLQEHYPGIHVLIVSMIEKEDSIIRMLKLKVKGYLCKDVEPRELGRALESIYDKGFYYTDFVTGKLVHLLQNETPATNEYMSLNEREKEFLTYACSELTYYEIADKMHLSPKTIDGYRSALFEKLQVKNRVGLALYAVKKGWVTL